MLDVKQVRTKTFRGMPFRYAELTNTGNPDRDHSSWYSFDDEQHLRDAWWNPQPGDTVLDIGAAYGSYALPALARGARVVCFSPADFDTAVLRKNLSLNPEFERRCLIERVGLHRGDGWFDPDKCEERIGPQYNYAKPSDPDRQWLRVMSLDSYLASRPGIDRVDWIKIDVEGAELDVLRGAEATLRRHGPQVLVENHEFHRKGIEADVVAFMKWIGYIAADGPHQHCAVSHTFFGRAK